MRSLLLAFFVLSSSSYAEYRVFMLQFLDANGKVLREFPSTLDPLQYPGYHPLAKGTQLFYTDTWICPGNTADFKPLCSSPRLAAPASTVIPVPTPSTPETVPIEKQP